MSVVWRITIFTCVLFIISSVSSTPVSKKVIEKPKGEPSDSTDGESIEKESGTLSPEGIENEEKSEPLTSKPEEVEQDKEFNKEPPETEEDELAKYNDNLKPFLTLYYRFKAKASENEEEVEEIKKTPAEMEEMKEETYRLINELNLKKGVDEVSLETFDEIWYEKEKESGKIFPWIIKHILMSLKESLEKIESTTAEITTLEVSEAITVISTQSVDVGKEESPKGAFTLRNTKGKICILAKFQSSIGITFLGKSSKLKVEVSIPHSAHTKGKCRGPNGSSVLQIGWEKFIFSLFFNKTSEDTWGVTSVELTYDTSEPLFDGAAEREKVTVKSKKLNLFETPFGKSYFCPAQQVIFLYLEDQHVAIVHLKEIHLQAYDVEDGKFSQTHRCNQVVIGGPEEEPYVQDETVPFAVGCTLALITVLILVGFSVHRAYNAAKVDYNTVE